MSPPFTPVTDGAQLEQLTGTTMRVPVVLFQHDPYCPISQRAYQQLRHLAHAVSRVDVSRQHELTRMIQERTSIRHESPQVIVFRAGRAMWSASHHAITQAAVEQAIQAEAHG